MTDMMQLDFSFDRQQREEFNVEHGKGPSFDRNICSILDFSFNFCDKSVDVKPRTTFE